MTWRRQSLTAAFLGLLIAVQASPASAVTSLNVSVTQTGIAIPGATISITNSSGTVVHSTRTGDDGSVAIQISTTGDSQVQLTEGTYTVTVTYGIFGISSQSRDFSVTGTDEETNVTFELSDPGAALTGTSSHGDVGGQVGDQGGVGVE
jgi:flagellar hook assembly protein FlgD